MQPASPPFAIGLSEFYSGQGRKCGYRPLRHRIRVHIPIEHLPVGPAGVETGEPIEPEIERLAADGIEPEEAVARPQIPPVAGPAEVAVKRHPFKWLEGIAWLGRENILVQKPERGRRGGFQDIMPHPVERRAVGPARVLHGPGIGWQPRIGSAVGRAHLLVRARGSFARAVVGHDVEVVTDKSHGQPQLQIQALSIAEGNGKQDIAVPGRVTDVRDAAIPGWLGEEPAIDPPVTGSLDGMCQRLQPQPLPPVVFAQGLWHVWRLSAEPGLAGAIEPGDVHWRALQLLRDRTESDGIRVS